MAFSTFTILCNYHLCPIAQQCHHPERKLPHPLSSHSPLSPPPWCLATCFLSLSIYLYWVFHISGLIQHVTFCVCLTPALHCISSFPFIPNAHSSLLLHRSGTSSDGLRVCASTYSCLCKKWSVVMSIYVLSAYLVFLWWFVSSAVLLFSVGCISSSDGPWVGPHLLLWWTMIWWS